MRRRITHLLVVVALCACVSPLRAQESAEATQHAEAQKLVEAGLEDARSGRFDAAVVHFEQALKLYPHPEIAHNLARAHQELGHPIEALSAFKRALEMDTNYTYAGDARKRITALDIQLRKTHGVVTVHSLPDKANVTILVGGEPFAAHLVTPVTHYVPAGTFEVNGTKVGFRDARLPGQVAAGADKTLELELKPLPKKGFLTVTADVKGAQVFIDGEQVGVTPLEGHAVAAGQHAVRISAEGRVDHKASVNVEPNAEQRVSATLPLVDGGEAASAGGGHGLLGGVLIGTGGASAIISATLWVMAVNKGVEAQPYGWHGATPDSKRWEALEATASDFNAGAVVTTVLAGGLIGTGVLLLLLPSGDEAAEPEASWTPIITPTAGGLGVGATVRF